MNMSGEVKAITEGRKVKLIRVFLLVRDGKPEAGILHSEWS